MNTETPPFKIGDKVVRVVTSDTLKVGKVYIVQDTAYCCDLWGWRLKLEGIPCPMQACMCNRINDFPYAAKCFRPVDELYEDCTAEIAESMVETREVPDKVRVKEVCES